LSLITDKYGQKKYLPRVPKILLRYYTIIHVHKKINYNYEGEHKLQVHEATYVQQSGFTISIP